MLAVVLEYRCDINWCERRKKHGDSVLEQLEGRARRSCLGLENRMLGILGCWGYGEGPASEVRWNACDMYRRNGYFDNLDVDHDM